MPSPFPGMDPYLEGDLWTTVHAQLGAEIARQLAPQLAPRYLALTTERFVLAIPQGIAIETGDVYPDISAVHTGLPGTRGGSTATAAPLQLATTMPVRVPQVSIEIRDTRRRRLVTAIEILSPTNKRGDGRKEYLSKRRRLLLSNAHLMEIDLVRTGKRVPMRQPLPSVPYFVLLSRVEKRPMLDVWPITFQDRLPSVAVPLLPGDADAALDLQQALTTIYDLIRYDLAIDYTRPADVLLPPAADAWADQLLRTAGKRS